MEESDYKKVRIKVETFLGEGDMDSLFFNYLKEYSIEHRITEDKGESGFPLVEYTGGPVSLTNMLREKFGMDREDINQIYPDINE